MKRNVRKSFNSQYVPMQLSYLVSLHAYIGFIVINEIFLEIEIEEYVVI